MLTPNSGCSIETPVDAMLNDSPLYACHFAAGSQCIPFLDLHASLTMRRDNTDNRKYDG